VLCYQVAVGHEYKSELQQHSSQTDAAKGFGGKYGVQTDRKDKSAVDYSYQEKLQQHASQTGLYHVTKQRGIGQGARQTDEPWF